jgi:hypothetical protein
LVYFALVSSDSNFAKNHARLRHTATRNSPLNLNFSLLAIMALPTDMLVHVALYLGPLETVRLALCSQSVRGALVGSEHFSACSGWVRHRMKFGGCLRAIKKISSRIHTLGTTTVHMRVIGNWRTTYIVEPGPDTHREGSLWDSTHLSIKSERATDFPDESRINRRCDSYAKFSAIVCMNGSLHDCCWLESVPLPGWL